MASHAWVAAKIRLRDMHVEPTERRLMIEACKIFEDLCPDHRCKRLTRFFGFWRKRVDEASSFSDRHRSGRKSWLAPALLEEASRIVCEGSWDEDGFWHSYTTLSAAPYSQGAHCAGVCRAGYEAT